MNKILKHDDIIKLKKGDIVKCVNYVGRHTFIQDFHNKIILNKPYKIIKADVFNLNDCLEANGTLNPLVISEEKTTFSIWWGTWVLSKEEKKMFGITKFWNTIERKNYET